MPVVTRVLDRETIALGLAQLRLAPYSSHEGTFGQALTSNEYFGAMSTIEFSINRSFFQRQEAVDNVAMVVDHILLSASFTITAQFVEITNVSFNYALGGEGDSVDFFITMVSDPEKLRAEMVFTYPNKSDQFVIVLPKVQIVSDNVRGQFQPENLMAVPFTIKALKSDNAAWAAQPYGRSLFTTI